MVKFAVRYGEYNQRDMKKAVEDLVSNQGIDFFSVDKNTRKFTVIGDVNPEDVVSRLMRRLGYAEIVPTEIQFGKIISNSCKCIVGLVTCCAAGYGIFQAT